MNDNKHFVLPKVYLVGYTAFNLDGLKTYLSDTDQSEFIEDMDKAKAQGLNDGEALCSFYAKLCYASLTAKKNKNISMVRDIESNLEGILTSGHGSVLEHCQLNFVVTDCSRIFTHEQVRHRVGTAYSQTSGRYVRTDELNIIVDPILTPGYDLVEEARAYMEDWYKRMEQRMDIGNVKDFFTKKKITSAMRRLLPNGQSNEMGFSMNLRTLRHTIEMRTSEHAEWEIRYIYNQIFELLSKKYPVMFSDAQIEVKDGMPEIKFINKKI